MMTAPLTPELAAPTRTSTRISEVHATRAPVLGRVGVAPFESSTGGLAPFVSSTQSCQPYGSGSQASPVRRQHSTRRSGLQAVCGDGTHMRTEPRFPTRSPFPTTRSRQPRLGRSRSTCSIG
jgi:hypothetical protein